MVNHNSEMSQEERVCYAYRHGHHCQWELPVGSSSGAAPDKSCNQRSETHRRSRVPPAKKRTIIQIASQVDRITARNLGTLSALSSSQLRVVSSATSAAFLLG